MSNIVNPAPEEERPYYSDLVELGGIVLGSYVNVSEAISLSTNHLTTLRSSGILRRGYIASLETVVYDAVRESLKAGTFFDLMEKYYRPKNGHQAELPMNGKELVTREEFDRLVAQLQKGGSPQ